MVQTGHQPPTCSVSGYVYLSNTQVADHAIVYLITLTNNGTLAAVDSTLISPNGYYEFNNIPCGHYLVKAALTHQSAYYHDFLPTYYIHSLFWHHATPVNVNGAIQHVNIFMIPGHNPGGPGFIGGSVHHGANKTSTDNIEGVQIMLLNMDDSPVAYTYSDMYGMFEFSNLAYGTYKVYAEWIGKTTYPVIVTISDATPSVNNITLEATETAIVSSIERERTLFGANISVFPNPASDNLKVSITSEKEMRLNLQLYNLTGQLILSQQADILQGENPVMLSVKELSRGIYFLHLNSDREMITKRIIVSK